VALRNLLGQSAPNFSHTSALETTAANWKVCFNLVARIDRLYALRKVTRNLNPKHNWGEDAQKESFLSAQEAKAKLNALRQAHRTTRS